MHSFRKYGWTAWFSWGLLLGAATAPTLGADSASPRPAWRFTDVDARSLKLWDGDQPVLVYNHGTMLKPGVPADRARASYIHPLYGLDAEVLTDDFPEDHHHHRGLFWGWPHVAVGDRKFDSWALQGIQNRWERWGRRETRGESAVLEVESGWYAGDEKLMSERLVLTAHPARDQARAIDLDFTWTPTRAPVRLAGAEGKSYGGLSLRYAPGTNTVITTPQGRSPEDLYITRLEWADLTRLFHGPAGSTPADSARVSGAAIFIARDHPDFPPTWLTRHYGVLCVGWPGVDGREFPAGEPIRCRYRVWIHRGEASPQRLQKAYEAFR